MKKWIIKDTTGSTLLEQIINARGIDKSFFLDNTLHNPFLMKDMDIAVEIIKDKIKKKQKIIVYGDYDVDGITSTVILTQYLNSIGANCEYFIPNRLTDGYGMNKNSIQKLADIGANLIITVDNGISAIMETDFARELKMDIIITDHHQCPQILPKANAILNPHNSNCKYPFKNLAGVGVVFKLITALSGDSDTILDEYSDIISIGTIADVMKLEGENRVIVSRGLKLLQKTNNIGLEKLIEFIKKGNISASTVGFSIAPMINASGRLGDAKMAVELLMGEKLENADLLKNQNDERRDLEHKTTQEIIEKLDKMPVISDVIILKGDDWHHGIIGIVASRISQKYHKPTILICMKDGIGKASGRSIKDFDLFSHVQKCEKHLEKFGGHSMAIGLTINSENIENFIQDMQNISNTKNLYPSIDIDVIIQEISVLDIQEISVLEPFGNGNPQPVFAFNEAVLLSKKSISDGKHLKLCIYKNGKKYDAMMFGTSEIEFCENDIINVAFCADINTFRNVENVTLMIKDIKAYNLNDLENLKSLEKITRKELIEIYKSIKKYGIIEEIYKIPKIFLALFIFKELGLIENGKLTDKKVNLEESKTFIQHGVNND